MSITIKTLAAAGLIFAALPAIGGVRDVDTPADVNHPDIHDKVGGGQDGARRNASPNATNDRAGGLHGIGNNPGQSGSKPGDDGTPGQANELGTMHGGIGSKNKNVD